MLPVKESYSKGKFLRRIHPVKESSSKGNFLKRMLPVKESPSKGDGNTWMYMPRSGPKTEPTLSQFILNFCERSRCFHNMFFGILKKENSNLRKFRKVRIQKSKKIKKKTKNRKIIIQRNHKLQKNKTLKI